MKNIGLLFFLSSFLVGTTSAQITNYRFVSSTTTPVDIAGAGTLISPGSALGFTQGTNNSIGFTFHYLGADYTHYSVNAAGLLKLGISGSTAVTNQAINDMVSVANIPKLMPWWDATYTGSSATSGGVFSQLSGTAPNRVLTIQWNVSYASAGATGTKYQLKLYETSNRIEFIYLSNTSTGMSSTVGLGGHTSSEYLNIFTSATGPIATNRTYDNSNSVWPGNNTVYSFTPVENFLSSTCDINPLDKGKAPLIWLKADEVRNITYSYKNVPGANRSSNLPNANTWSGSFLPSNSTITGSTTGWLPNAGNGGNNNRPLGGYYLELNLGSVQTIDGLVIAGCSACTPQGWVLDYAVMVSSDGTNWTSLGQYQGPTGATDALRIHNDFPAPASCQFIRIYPGAMSGYRVLRADAYTKSLTAVANNAKVSFWEDQTYNNNYALQATAANQMTLRTNQINGNPALISANATNTWMDIPDQSNLRTTFWVAKDNSATGTNYFHILCPCCTIVFRYPECCTQQGQIISIYFLVMALLLIIMLVQVDKCSGLGQLLMLKSTIGKMVWMVRLLRHTILDQMGNLI